MLRYINNYDILFVPYKKDIFQKSILFISALSSILCVLIAVCLAEALYLFHR